MVHFGILEQPNLLPASSHQESPGWFFYASSSCFLLCTSPHTSIYPHAHTNTHILPRPWRYPCVCGLAHFLLSFLKWRGVESKAENTWHLSPLGAAMEEGRPRFGEGGGVLKHLVSVWQRQGNCCFWTARQGIYGCVCICVFLHLGKLQVFTTWILFYLFHHHS